MKESAEWDFRAYGRPLTLAPSSKYLVQILTASDDDWPAVVKNLRKEKKKWAQLTRILGWEGSNMRVLGTYPKAVVQAVLLFGSEMWVMTPRMRRALGGFQNMVA